MVKLEVQWSALGLVMEWLGFAGGMISQLLFYGVIVWVIVRVVRGRREGEPGDQAVSVRRLFVYGLMFATVVLTAVGAVLVAQELIGPSEGADGDRSALAFGLALVIVAGPAYGLLLRHARRRLGELSSERRSFGWAAYLNLSLLVSLVVTIVTAQQLLEGVTGVEEFEGAALVPVVVWGAVWAVHWFWLKAAYGLPGDAHLAAGSLTGLITLAIGVGGLVYVAGDEIYTELVDVVPARHEDPVLGRWLIAALLGVLVWSWHWLARYVRAERTPLWHVYVVVIGALGGLVATVGAAATIGYWTLVWFLGEPTAALSSEHFEYVPAAATAVLVVGVVTWQYHRWVLQAGDQVARREPLRTYDYVMAGAGLVATVVAVTLALVALLEAITPAPAGTDTSIANRLILAVTLAVIGAPLWWVFWSRVRRHVAEDPGAELESTVRRIYLIVLFGVGGIVILASLISVLYIAIEGLLEGTFGGQTIRSLRVGLSLLVTVTGVAWYHLAVFRSDRKALTAVEPVPAPPVPRHVVLIAPRGIELADELATATGADLESWYRTDVTTIPDLDLDELAARIEASDAHDVLVVVGPAGATLTPFET
jgi:hypothetical protein